MFALACLLCWPVIPVVEASETEWPGEHWTTRAPAEAGLDARALASFSAFTGGRGCVVRHGCLVHSWGDPAARGDVASACKPVFVHFLFRAIEEGRLAGLDVRVATVEPRLLALNPALDHKDAAITFRHMANQVSCYGVTEAPGTAFDYNDWQIALFADTLVEKVHGMTWERADAELLGRLAAQLECEDAPTWRAMKATDRAGRLAISPRDFARFGLLYLHHGRWRDRELLAAEHARLAVTTPLPAALARTRAQDAGMIPGQRTLGSQKVPDDQTDHMGSYSFAWWTNGVDRDGRRHWPDAPTDTFAALGHGGKRALVVIPSLDLVVSWNDTRIDGPASENEALRRLVESVRGDR